MGERVPGERRVNQVCQALRGTRGCLDQLVQLGPKETMVLLVSRDQRETLDQSVLRDFQVHLVQLEEKDPRGNRGT